MLHGTVKLWKENEGWGFIQGDDDEDYFVNISNVRRGQKLGINKRVKFDATQGHKGPEAENVTLY